MSNNTMTLIIGSGPAGYTAGIYAARAGLEPIMISGFQPGGQLTTTSMVENFPGFSEPIDGTELMNNMHKQAENLGVKMISDHVKSVDFSKKPFSIETDLGKTFTSNSIIISTGSSPKKSGVKGEDKFIGYGVSFCATCDGFFYRGKDVAILGGGNSAIVEALLLSHFTNSVTIIARSKLRGEKILIDKVLSNPKIKVKLNSTISEIYGTDAPKSLTGVKIENLETGDIKDLAVAGVFVAIGHSPNTSIFEGKIDLDNNGYIKLKENSTETSIEGIFAAGDVTNPRYKQAVIAAGLGCEAALDVEKYLNK